MLESFEDRRQGIRTDATSSGLHAKDLGVSNIEGAQQVVVLLSIFSLHQGETGGLQQSEPH